MNGIPHMTSIIELRCAVAEQPTSDQQLIETLEPSDARRIADRDQ
jgi:hypothetical protein